MIISFAWTTPALLAGAKTVTRREWTAEHARLFTVGMLVDAWDRSPRTRKGRKVATIRIIRPPHLEWNSDLSEEDVDREGFNWLRAHGEWVQVEQILSAWRAERRLVWVVEFKLVEVLPPDGTTMPRRGPSAQGRADAQHLSSRRGGHGS